jgi:hypothetical protein
VSKKMRSVLWELCPEIVATAEGFASEVLYVPVSATGRGPEIDPETGIEGMRPRDMSPIWVEVPLLYALCKWMRGIVPYAIQRSTPDTAPVFEINGQQAPLHPIASAPAAKEKSA